METRAQRVEQPGTTPRALERAFVWLGGGMFVTALLAAGWTYVVTWSYAAPFSGARSARSVAWNALLLTAFATHHSLFARERIKTTLVRAIPPRLVRSVYVWVASSLLLLVLGAWQPVGGTLYTGGGGRLVLAAAQLAGLWLTIRAARTIHALELAGIRAQEAVDDATSAQELQVGGPYGVVRHPLYLGWLLMVFGATPMTGDRLLFATVTSLYLVVAIPMEERSLGRAFGPAYSRYRERVRWRMIPYVY
jgi:methanethiol S-methyltransferase